MYKYKSDNQQIVRVTVIRKLFVGLVLILSLSFNNNMNNFNAYI